MPTKVEPYLISDDTILSKELLKAALEKLAQVNRAARTPINAAKKMIQTFSGLFVCADESREENEWGATILHQEKKEPLDTDKPPKRGAGRAYTRREDEICKSESYMQAL